MDKNLQEEILMGTRMLPIKKTDKKGAFWNRKRRTYLFIALVLALPILHFLVMYVYVNINSILLGFKDYDSVSGDYLFTGFHHFKDLFEMFRTDSMLIASLKNSTTLYLVGLFICTPLNILIAFAVYKKIPMSSYFRFVMFLPSIISGMVFVLIYKYFLEYGLREIGLMMGVKVPALLTGRDTAFPMMIIYGIWTGFGMGIVLYSNAMSRIPESLVEYGELEGMNRMQELWHIVIPMIFPTFTTFLVCGVAGFFTSQGASYAFFGPQAGNENITTLGYYFFIKVVSGIGGSTSPAEYPFASAAGLVFTLIAAPITLIVKWALEKYGPSSEY